MSTTSLPVPAHGPAVARRPALDDLFGSFWPETSRRARPRLVLAAVVAGGFAAVVLPDRDAGLGTFLVLIAVSTVVAVADGQFRTPYHRTSGVLVALLLAMVVLRDADWVVALCQLAALSVAVAVLTDGRSVPGLLVAGLTMPLASLRGLPWLSRSLTSSVGGRSWLPAIRAVTVTTLLVVVFGLLFSSADAVFASWVHAVLPDLTPPGLGLRGFVLVAVSGLTLLGVYVATNPPHVEIAALPTGRPVRLAFEWLVPVAAVVVVFAGFVVAQATVMFGGHDYLHRTTGLTYASYVHQGFGQLTAATVLTLVVVAVAARKAGRTTGKERLLLRVVLGALCLLTLLVVASALFRMHVYEQAYGFTRLRLLVSVFEGWLGLVVLLVLVAGIRISGGWLPRAALLTGATALLLLAASNPDASIARHNLERRADTGRVDGTYLSSLSTDAAQVLAGTSFAPGCHPSGDDWLAWNLGRYRAGRACD